MQLTDAQIRNAQAKSKLYRLTDGLGLCLLVSPEGGKYWRFRWSRASDKKESEMSLGTYPEISLAQAREKTVEARKQLREGKDPLEQRRLVKKTIAEALKLTFGAVCKEWQSVYVKTLRQQSQQLIEREFKLHILPYIGELSICSIEAPILLEKIIRPLEKQGMTSTAHSVVVRIGQVLRFARASGIKGVVDCTPDLRGALVPHKRKHHPALTSPEAIGRLLRDLDSYTYGTPSTAVASRLLPMLLCRPDEMIQMQWKQLSEDRWLIPREITKTDEDRIVPLSKQALALLSTLQKECNFVFPSKWVGSCEHPMSEDSLTRALRKLGYSGKHVPHGWRATARTLLDEILHERIDWIELQLGHMVRDPLGRAYNRTAFLAERRAMMQKWSDYLDTLKAAANGNRTSTEAQNALVHRA